MTSPDSLKYGYTLAQSEEESGNGDESGSEVKTMIASAESQEQNKQTDDEGEDDEEKPDEHPIIEEETDIRPTEEKDERPVDEKNEHQADEKSAAEEEEPTPTKEENSSDESKDEDSDVLLPVVRQLQQQVNALYKKREKDKKVMRWMHDEINKNTRYTDKMATHINKNKKSIRDINERLAAQEQPQKKRKKKSCAKKCKWSPDEFPTEEWAEQFELWHPSGVGNGSAKCLCPENKYKGKWKPGY